MFGTSGTIIKKKGLCKEDVFTNNPASKPSSGLQSLERGYCGEESYHKPQIALVILASKSLTHFNRRACF
jgi:hypothetical protein